MKKKPPTPFFHSFVFSILKLTSLAIASILGVFCNFGGTMYGPAVEYGMPYATYKVMGAIKALDNNAPIKGLQVSIKDTANYYESDSSFTDSLGKYSLVDFSGFPSESKTLLLSVVDVDSDLNGSFTNKDTLITFKNTDLHDPSGTWNEGTAEKIIDINLDAKN